ncbi:MAG: helix-turn-helix transcriptional regulator [Bacteroidota bacterium]
MTDNHQLDQAKIIGKRIRTKRSQLDLSRPQLAEMSGLKVGTIERVEAGSRFPGAEHVLALCKVLDMSPNFMILGTENFADDADLEKELYAVSVVFGMLDSEVRSVLYKMMKSLVMSKMPDDQLPIFEKILELSISSGVELGKNEDMTMGDVMNAFAKSASDVLGQDVSEEILGSKDGR